MSYYKDDNDRFVSFYSRIKILTDAGRKYADVEIPVGPGESLKQLKARTVHPDGAVIEFTGTPFEKTIVKGKGIKYAARTFTFPDVTVGSIVEYSYLLALPRGEVNAISEWPIQSDLFTVKERLRFRPYQGAVHTSGLWNFGARKEDEKTEVAYSYLHQVDASVPEKRKGNLMELELQNVAAFDAEENMPPQEDYKPLLLFYYGGREFVSPEKFWQEWQKLLSQSLEKFISNSEAVRQAAIQAIGNEADPEGKLRKLYARAQQIRNLSFERERTVQEEKKENLKRNATAQEVLERGYGTRWEIDAVLVALARAAGFDASLLGVSEREVRSFDKLLLWLGQLDGAAALVTVNGKDVALDPGTRFAPYGVLRWPRTAVTALNFKPGGDFTTTPPPGSSILTRSAKITLAADGSASGELTVQLGVQESLEHRLEALKTDEAGRRKSFEEEVRAWLPKGAVVKILDSPGWDTTDTPLTARFAVTLPSFASVAGKRMVVPSFLFSTLQKDMFARDYRQFPIAFAYPFAETDAVSIRLPDGYTMEVAPYPRKAALRFAAYEVSSVLQEQQLTTLRSLRFDGFSFPPEQYFELRGFFTVVHTGDSGQAVLQKKGPAPAGSQN
jgi:hypothetical protein